MVEDLREDQGLECRREHQGGGRWEPLGAVRQVSDCWGCQGRGLDGEPGALV